MQRCPEYIDEAIRCAICRLNKEGFYTAYSCAGHDSEYFKDNDGYIAFMGVIIDSGRFSSLLKYLIGEYTVELECTAYKDRNNILVEGKTTIIRFKAKGGSSIEMYNRQQLNMHMILE